MTTPSSVADVTERRRAWLRQFWLVFAAVLAALLVHDLLDGAIEGIRAALQT